MSVGVIQSFHSYPSRTKVVREDSETVWAATQRTGRELLADNQKEQRSRPDSLRILSYNLGAGGLGAERLNNSNGHRLALLMEDLEALKNNFDIIGLSETHCTE